MIASFVSFEAKGRAVLNKVEIAPLKPGEALLESDYTVVSAGTERANLVALPNTDTAESCFPFQLGYCGAGRVVALGEGVENLKIGDRAVLPGGITVYTGSTSHLKPGGRDDLGTVETIFQVVVRTVGKDGADLLVSEIEVETWFTNLPESPEVVVELYHSTDMDMERPPSGEFATNSLLLCLAKLAFNVLRLIGQTSLEFKAWAPVKVKLGGGWRPSSGISSRSLVSISPTATSTAWFSGGTALG